MRTAIVHHHYHACTLFFAASSPIIHTVQFRTSLFVPVSKTTPACLKAFYLSLISSVLHSIEVFMLHNSFLPSNWNGCDRWNAVLSQSDDQSRPIAIDAGLTMHGWKLIWIAFPSSVSASLVPPSRDKAFVLLLSFDLRNSLEHKWIEIRFQS
jgi:hypothetical protein